MNYQKPLLSIAIPAYGRAKELRYCIERFIAQVKGKYETTIEIIISDDASPGDALREVRDLAEQHPFIHFRRYQKNIGLERNLIACTEGCTGEFLWIFGDDDFLEPADGLDHIMALLQADRHDFILLNRTRRSFDLTKLITDNWMRLPSDQSTDFRGLRDFCLAHGFISVIGFISVNVFRREPFQRVDASKYMGTMYPQLGAMLEAFHNRPTLLVGRPLVCHRTQTSEEKKAALGAKQTEAAFMADVRTRNATYFSHPYIRMLAELVRQGAFTPSDIVKIPEHTVINGLLVDFLLQTVQLSRELQVKVDEKDWARTAEFFAAIPLDPARRALAEVACTRAFAHSLSSAAKGFSVENRMPMTISVVSPSFNQAEFLDECLTSVKVQTYPAIEHLVFDPGSTDGSRAIAAKYKHVTLIEESDSGQSDALNKGFARVRGDIVAWLNSDDCFADPGVFERVIRRFEQADAPDIVYGRGIYIDEVGNKLRDVYVNKDPTSLEWRFQQEDGILQPALFMRRSVLEQVGPLRNDLHYCMDYEYWIRCLKARISFVFLDDCLAVARYHSSNKTYGMRGKSYSEVCDMMLEHFGYVNHVWLMRYAEFLTEGHDGVLANASNRGIKDAQKLNQIYRELLRDYNASFDTFDRLKSRASQKGYGDTFREMNMLGIQPPVPCKPIPLDQATEAGCVCYSVGSRRWAYEAKWKAGQIAKTHDFFRARIRERRSDTCIIVGNGPSLNRTDLSLLKGQDVIISNNAFLSKELMESATYFTTVNYLVAEQSKHHINRIQGISKVLPYWLAYCLNTGDNTFFVDAVGRPEFSTDIFKNISWRHTVTFFNLHLAYGLGYRKVIMIGFDHTYKQPKGVAEQEVIQSYEEDENHFHPSYFRGKKWQAADVGMMEEMYRLANEAFVTDGRQIINATVGGELELFPRMSLAEALVDARAHHPAVPSGRPPVPVGSSGPLIGSYARDDHAHWDETNGVANLFSTALQGKTMIDVGAHHGTALVPFLDRGWRVFAFEPDDRNRSKLLERLAQHAYRDRVQLDTRCVSNKSQSEVAFYRSEQSTGISGLSAFHESHMKTQSVDTVSLKEYFATDGVPDIDFLKVDTEGHDLLVLQGFPWDVTRPAVVECEFENSKTVPLGYTFYDLADFLVERGYTVYVSEWHPIVRYGTRHDWKHLTRYPCHLSNDKGWGNLIAFRDPIDEDILINAIEKVITVGSRVPSRNTIADPGRVEALAATNFRVATSENFISAPDNVWRYTASNGLGPQQWQSIFENRGSIADRTIAAGIRLRSNKAITVAVGLCRHGYGEFEGVRQQFVLEPGIAQSIQIRKTFTREYDALRIQVEVMEPIDVGTVELMMDSIYLMETPTSLCRRSAGKDLSLTLANRLFRQKEYATAMVIYALLRRRHALHMYNQNALMAAQKLGLGATSIVDDLVRCGD